MRKGIGPNANMKKYYRNCRNPVNAKLTMDFKAQAYQQAKQLAVNMLYVPI